jgi:hypothetical protein
MYGAARIIQPFIALGKACAGAAGPFAATIRFG